MKVVSFSLDPSPSSSSLSSSFSASDGLVRLVGARTSVVAATLELPSPLLGEAGWPGIEPEAQGIRQETSEQLYSENTIKDVKLRCIQLMQM